ncbi:hypothetical protein M758_12G180800 [Ceratodon purpureus]|nr:hypothetical protein M758_12G180800 [Ceratodon purpureus]
MFEDSNKMEDERLKRDEMVAQLLSMGFEHHLALEAMSNPKLHSIHDVVDYLLTGDLNRDAELPLRKCEIASSDLQESNSKRRANVNDGSCNLWNFKEKVKASGSEDAFVCLDETVAPVETSSKRDAMKTSIEAPVEETQYNRENNSSRNQGFWPQEDPWAGFNDEIFNDDEPPLQKGNTAEVTIVTRVTAPVVPKKKLVIGYPYELGCTGTSPGRSKEAVPKDAQGGADVSGEERLTKQGEASSDAEKATHGMQKLTDRLTGSSSCAQTSPHSDLMLNAVQKCSTGSNSWQEFRVVMREPVQSVVITDRLRPTHGTKRNLESDSPTLLSSENAMKRNAFGLPGIPEVNIPDDSSTGGKDSSRDFGAGQTCMKPMQIVTLESEPKSKVLSSNADRCLKAVDAKAKLVDAELVIEMKPTVENRHVPVLLGRRNPGIRLGCARVKTEVADIEDVKPRDLGLLKKIRNDEQDTCVQKKRKRGTAQVKLDPDGPRVGGPPKTYILSKLNGGTPKLVEWEKAALTALRKYFGYQELKGFQREALEAWAENRDSFVLAATGSGKSLCFQLPALMTNKVVIVVSPLISLMHDQCLQLARRGVSACFLGSGQVDKTIELKAMAGIFNIVYVCPETLPRLENYLQGLARGKGIALFAVDEAHCISKWGHDFRPTYRQLSMLRDKFKVGIIPGLKHQIPIMALTATATPCVRDDILKSLGIAAGNPRIVLTTFFRPNLYFSVHHSKTTKETSYEDDFASLIKTYSKDCNGFQRTASVSEGSLRRGSTNSSKQDSLKLKTGLSQVADSAQSTPSVSWSNIDRNKVLGKKLAHEEDLVILSDDEDDEVESYSSGDGDGLKDNDYDGAELTAQFLEDEDEDERLGGDCFVECGEFSGRGAALGKSAGQHNSGEVEMGEGPTIIYMPTRKETEAVAKFLCGHGVIAAAYHAKLPRAHLRQVHEGFHGGTLQVVVATIAFGMGIDKPNVRRVIHYGWPQSLEAYYQEAGRAGRDGARSDCELFVDMTVLPSLLPSRRDAVQTKHSLEMLSQCFRYGIHQDCCRVKTILQYFGEVLQSGLCNMCDVCLKGPPPPQDLTREAVLLLTAIAAPQMEAASRTGIQLRERGRAGRTGRAGRGGRTSGSPSMRPEGLTIKDITEQMEKQEIHRDRLWWRGFVRILADRGFIRNATSTITNKLVVPTIKYPVLTPKGHDFLRTQKSTFAGTSHDVNAHHPLMVHLEGDMVQALRIPRNNTTEEAKEWGRGWADPEIRRQRLGKRGRGRSRKRGRSRQKQQKADTKSVWGRLANKLGLSR